MSKQLHMIIPFTWMVVGLSLMGHLGGGLAHYGLPALLPFIREDFGLNRAQVGLITSGLSLGGFLVLFSGMLIDRVGVRRVMPITLIGIAIGVLLFAQSHSLIQSVLFASLVGSIGSAKAPASTKAIIDWVGVRTRGLAMGIKETSAPLSAIIATSLLPFLAITLGWRNASMLIALPIVIISIVFFMFYQDNQTFTGKTTDGNLRNNLALLTKNRAVWLVIIFGASLAGVERVIASYLMLFLKEHLGMSVVLAGGFLAIAQAGSVVGRVVWSLISDFLLHGNRVAVLVPIGLLSVLCMAILTWLPSDATSTTTAIIVFTIGSIALGWQGVGLVYLTELASPRLTGTVIGFALVTIQLSGAITTPLFGFVVDQTGSYDMGWWMMAALVGTGTLMVSFAYPRNPRASSH